MKAPVGPVFLYKLETVSVQQSGEFLEAKIAEAIGELKEAGLEVVGVVAGLPPPQKRLFYFPSRWSSKLPNCSGQIGPEVFFGPRALHFALVVIADEECDGSVF